MRRRPPALRLHACSPRAWDCHARRGTRHASTLFTRLLLSTFKQPSLGPVWIVSSHAAWAHQARMRTRPHGQPRRGRGGQRRLPQQHRQQRRQAQGGQEAQRGAAARLGAAAGAAGHRRERPACGQQRRQRQPRRSGCQQRGAQALRGRDWGLGTLTFEHAMESADRSAAGASRGGADARRQRAGTPWREVGAIL